MQVLCALNLQGSLLNIPLLLQAEEEACRRPRCCNQKAEALPRYVPPPDFSDLQCTCETTWCPLPYGLRLGTAVWDHYARKFQNEDSSESVSSSETPTHGQVPTRQKGFMPDWFYAAANKHMHLTGEVDNTQSVSCKAPQKKTMACFSPLLDTSCAYWCNRSTHPTVIPSPSSVRTTRTRTQRPRPPRPGQTPLSTRQSPRAQHSQTRPPQQTGSQTVAQTPQTVDLSPATRASTQQQPQGARSSLVHGFQLAAAGQRQARPQTPQNRQQRCKFSDTPSLATVQFQKLEHRKKFVT